jgi:hypothetical protein
LGKAINRFHFLADDELRDQIQEAMSRLELSGGTSPFCRDTVRFFLVILSGAPPELRGLDLQVYMRDAGRLIAQARGSQRSTPSPVSEPPRPSSNGVPARRTTKPAR